MKKTISKVFQYLNKNRRALAIGTTFGLLVGFSLTIVNNSLVLSTNTSSLYSVYIDKADYGTKLQFRINEGLDIDLNSQQVRFVKKTDPSSVFSVDLGQNVTSSIPMGLLENPEHSRGDIILRQQLHELERLSYVLAKPLRIDFTNLSKSLVVLRTNNSDYPFIIIELVGITSDKVQARVYL